MADQLRMSGAAQLQDRAAGERDRRVEGERASDTGARISMGAGRGVSRGDAGAKDFTLAYDQIENMEQAVIQHIRTSGIRKPRETSLIDELMDMRRERRKLFAALSERGRSLSTQCEGLLGDLAHVRDKQGRAVGRLESQVSPLVP
jgi:hypothetical protein